MSDPTVSADVRPVNSPDAMEAEVFRDVVGEPGYQVSNLGRIRGIRSGRGTRKSWRVIVLVPDPRGYPRICFSRDGKRRFVRVHKLVLEAFVGPCPPGLEGCHDDGNPANNRLDNLRWDTHRANMEDVVRHCRRARGTECSFAKLDDTKVQLIRFLVTHHGASHNVVGRIFGIQGSGVCRILQRKIWSHVPDVDPEFAPSLSEWFNAIGLDLPDKLRLKR